MTMQVKLCLLFLILCGNISAQMGVSAVYSPSKIIKHSDNLLFDVPSLSHEYRLGLTFQTSGKNRWEKYWNRPRIAINTIYVDFGDNEVLGKAYALIPELHFTLSRWKKLNFNMQFGTGIAYLSKPFNAISNPINNAISSNLNNSTSLKFGLEYQIMHSMFLNMSTGIVHFSNGNSSSPNTGINIFGASMGFIYQFDRIPKEEKNFSFSSKLNTEPLKYKKWILDIQYQYGLTEHTVPGGPKFGVQILSLGAGYRYSEFMTLLVGGEYEYNDGVYRFYKFNFETEEVSKQRAKKTILYIENEFRYGSVFSRLRFGFYLGWPAENSKFFFTKLVTGVYLPKIYRSATPYVAVALKTHIATADYLAMVFGVRI